MRVTATEAKNRFGSLSAQATREPVFVEKAGQLDTMILSAERYQALQAKHEKGPAARHARRHLGQYRTRPRGRAAVQRIPLTAFARALTLSGPSPACKRARTRSFSSLRRAAGSSSNIARRVLLLAALVQ